MSPFRRPRSRQVLALGLALAFLLVPAATALAQQSPECKAAQQKVAQLQVLLDGLLASLGQLEPKRAACAARKTKDAECAAVMQQVQTLTEQKKVVQQQYDDAVAKVAAACKGP